MTGDFVVVVMGFKHVQSCQFRGENDVQVAHDSRHFENGVNAPVEYVVIGVDEALR